MAAAWRIGDAEGISLPDRDRDDWPDFADNCPELSNHDQLDSDNDGFGNPCDPDLNNDGIVDALDITRARACAGADLSIQDSEGKTAQEYAKDSITLKKS